MQTEGIEALLRKTFWSINSKHNCIKNLSCNTYLTRFSCAISVRSKLRNITVSDNKKEKTKKKFVSFEPISHKVDIFIFEKNVFQLAYQCFLFCFRKINFWKIRNNQKQKKPISRNTISLVTQHINVLGKEVQVIITCQVFAITPTYNWDK